MKVLAAAGFALMVVAACAAVGPRQVDWTLPSARMPGLTVVCGGEREVTAEECLAIGERHAIAPSGVRADRIEIYTRPPGHRCLFTLKDAAGTLLLSATGPCER